MIQVLTQMIFFSKLLNFDVANMCVPETIENVDATDLTDYVCSLSVTQDSIKGILSTNLVVDNHYYGDLIPKDPNDPTKTIWFETKTTDVYTPPRLISKPLNTVLAVQAGH